MDKERLNEALEKLFDASDLIYTLKTALFNQEQPTPSTLPYAVVAKMIEKKINSVSGLIADIIEG